MSDSNQGCIWSSHHQLHWKPSFHSGTGWGNERVADLVNTKEFSGVGVGVPGHY